MPRNHLLRDYRRMPDSQVGDFALHVADMFDANVSVLPAPPVKPADLRAKANEFIAAVAVCQDGTREDTLHKNALLEELLSMLDDLAKYAELTAKNDPEILAASGFDLAGGPAVKPAPVGTVDIVSVTNGVSGSLQLELNISPNVWSIEVEASTAAGAIVRGVFTDPRNVVLKGLTPGTMYSLHARVYGSLNQVSDWSNPVSHMAT